MFVLSELSVSQSYAFDLSEDIINVKQTGTEVKHPVRSILSTAHV